ncbi:MFS transporter [Phyllobacterium sp. 21LDTY02-6]|uniref:MFS transporter n=1 Tax=unclassified Phyllobacterium TaxID=2638441 RepID=UPI002020DE26|nr:MULTISPECIES: MFS transporter [unclassified Phyllobacterium]MCO4316485.1 MFS transporter [Phyllobacterium sp. 21LDTY02-6]MCX8280713.1 MFS transporter [Phyllobacterium sp. 0TCS1.6C]MCX8292710.1 MFS transporter [Phyllobacterium sp. 0TCS1.6A]
MINQVRHPIWIDAAKRPTARVFAILFGIESMARAIITSVVPIQTYDLMQSERGVSILYTCMSLLGLISTLSIPMLIVRIPRRWVYTSGAAALILGCCAFALDTLPGQALGLFLRTFGAGTLSITLSLYIMDHIKKGELVRAESVRMATATLAWTGGPFVGVFLYTKVGMIAPFLASICFSLLLLGLFWYFRLSDNPALQKGPSRPANPIANIRRFVVQPRLRLAWLIAFARSCYWSTFFVYGPILMVATGQGSLAGGLLVSLGNLFLLASILWGKIGMIQGLTRTISGVFVLIAAALIGAGIAGAGFPMVAALMLLVGAFFCVALDTLASTTFIRAVHPHERAQMTAVYRTYLDFSEIVPAFVYSIILSFFNIGAIFIALAGLMVFTAVFVWRYLPRRL